MTYAVAQLMTAVGLALALFILLSLLDPPEPPGAP